MAKKSPITSDDILTFYMDFVVEHQTKPYSIDEFCSFHSFKAKVFYTHFDSFKSVEKTVFKTLFDNSVDVLLESDEFVTFDNKNKLISLYFTFFENLTLNKEYVQFVLKGFENKLKVFSVFSELKKSFKNFINVIELDTFILNVDGLENIQKKSIKEVAWFQLLLTIEFWLSDTSDSFEKTDIFIEKSINTSFDLLDNTFLKSVIDLGKFLYKERVKS